jgi:hypothetical protein
LKSVLPFFLVKRRGVVVIGRAQCTTALCIRYRSPFLKAVRTREEYSSLILQPRDILFAVFKIFSNVASPRPTPRPPLPLSFCQLVYRGPVFYSLIMTALTSLSGVADDYSRL